MVDGRLPTEGEIVPGDAAGAPFRGFRILRRLGSGGMGVVYEAHDLERNERVALKTVRRMSGDDLLRLKNEFRSLQDLHHPNLVSLGELREESGRWFFTMELIRGVSILHYVRPLPGGDTADTGAPSGPPSDPAGLASAETMRFPWDLGAAERSQKFDEGRLRSVLGQLARGLCALHAAGKVHRDVKPSNILVDAHGRLAILDFGLVAEVDKTGESSTARAVGTADYMAPEQAASHQVGPEADWYGVGVVLYQALTGQLPFEGSPLKVMLQKQQTDAPRPREAAPDVPADLDALCAALTRFDPRQRPTGAEVMLRLGVDPDPVESLGPSSSFTQTSPFVGREAELTELQDAFDAAAEGTAVAVLVEGEAGIGKSTLVRQFTEQLQAQGVAVLAGRSYEREAVPYKAVDGLVDALSHLMMRMSDGEAAAILPRHADLLGQVFPVLRRVTAVAQAPALHAGKRIDRQELRGRLFSAMRDLMARIADRRRVVMVVDDLQWADADSLALLAEMLRPPESPALLLVGLYRTGSAPDLGRLLPGDVRHLRVEPLPPPTAERLATALLQRATVASQEHAAAIAREAKGHPLFIDELVRHAATRDDDGPVIVRLDQALLARIAALPERARRVLQLVAVAGIPLLQRVVARAAGLDVTEFSRAAGLLRVGNLVLTTGSRSTDEVGTYHHWVREAVSNAMSPEERQERHRSLALSLEATPGADPEVLATHWRGAGDTTKAATYAAQAGAAAEAALAFNHAARLYRMALELTGDDPAIRQDLRIKLADALANAGRGREAGDMYVEAAEHAPRVQGLELQRRAGEQYLRNGHIDDGLAMMKQVLAAVGMQLPATPTGALLSLLARRAMVRLRGLRFTRREAGEVSPAELNRLDLLWSVASSLAVVDTIRGCDFNARNLLMALRAGEPSRLMRAVALEASFVSFQGHPAATRTEHLLQTMWALVKEIDRPEIGMWAHAAHGMADYYLARFRSSLDHVEQSIEIGRSQCTGVSYEVGSEQMFALWNLANLGRMAELARRGPQLVADALDRGDLYVATNLRLSLNNLAWLVGDDAAEARRMASEATGRWSREAFHTQHWFDLLAQTNIDLYEGQGDAGLARVGRHWRDLSRSLLLRIQIVRIEVHHLRARCALAAARHQPAEAERHLRLAEQAARKIRRERIDLARALALLVDAGVASCRGRTDQARTHLEAAIPALRELDLALYATVARRRLGELCGGEDGRAQVDTANAWMAREKVKNPGAWTGMLVPGFPD